MNGKTNVRLIAPSSGWLVVFLLLVMGCGSPEKGTFTTPEEAVEAVAGLVGTGDVGKTNEIFGPGGADLIYSGDEATDREDAERIKTLIGEKLVFEDLDENTKVAYVGDEAWSLPIPLVRTPDGKRWRFDTEAGREELLNRRVGRNELWTLTSLHALVDAQYEYRGLGHGDDAPAAFAQKFLSDDGERNGLYWPPVEGEDPSPIGDLLAEADRNADPGSSFHGYRYRMLFSQGANAPGGERSYLDEQGFLTGGFAAIAWPAKYGNSGVMTFVINHRGIAFQKDLGVDTEAVATEVQSFDPDMTWEPTGDLFAIGVDGEADGVS